MDVGNLLLLPLSGCEWCENLYLKNQNLLPFVLPFWPVWDKILYWKRLQQFSDLGSFLEMGFFEAKFYLQPWIFIYTSHFVWFGWNSARNLQIMLLSSCEFAEKLQGKAFFSYEPKWNCICVFLLKPYDILQIRNALQSVWSVSLIITETECV